MMTLTALTMMKKRRKRKRKKKEWYENIRKKSLRKRIDELGNLHVNENRNKKFLTTYTQKKDQ